MMAGNKVAKDFVVNKVVLVIGETGVGKSTILNMLYNDDHSVSSCKEPQKTGSTAGSVTKASTCSWT